MYSNFNLVKKFDQFGFFIIKLTIYKVSARSENTSFIYFTLKTKVLQT